MNDEKFPKVILYLPPNGVQKQFAIYQHTTFRADTALYFIFGTNADSIFVSTEGLVTGKVDTHKGVGTILSVLTKTDQSLCEILHLL